MNQSKTNQPETARFAGGVGERLAADARTVEHADDYLKELKSQVDAILDPATAATCGYITPSAEIHVRQLQLSYWKTRNALYELVYDIWRDIERLDRATPEQFLVALAAASLLVDAARFLARKVSSLRCHSPQAGRARHCAWHSAANVR